MNMKANTISIVELLRKFPNDQACIDWLEQVCWNGEPVCPHCGGVENISKPLSKPNTYWHKDCKKQFTVTTKSIMHATKTPLQNWVVAIYSVMTARKGVSAMQLSKELGGAISHGVVYASPHQGSMLQRRFQAGSHRRS